MADVTRPTSITTIFCYYYYVVCIRFAKVMWTFLCREVSDAIVDQHR